MSKNNFQKPYNIKKVFHKENYLSKEEAKKLKNWLTIGYVGNYIDSSEPFSNNKEIFSSIKKNPYSFKKLLDDVKCVDRKIILYGMSILTLSGKDGKNVLNDIFLKYVKSLSDLYYFVNFSIENKTNKINVIPYITKYIRNQSFEKIHKEILINKEHETGIKFSTLIQKYNIEGRNQKEEIFFKSLYTRNMKTNSHIFQDYENIRKNKFVNNLEKFNFEMLPEKYDKRILNHIVKQTSGNTILSNIDLFSDVESIDYAPKISLESINKYIACKAYNKCDSAIKTIIKEKFNRTLKKKICNIIDYDLAGIETDELACKNIPFLFSHQFEYVTNIIFETHERFREVELDIENVLEDNEAVPLKLRNNTTIYVDNFFNHLMEQNKKIDNFIFWSYGKDLTIKKDVEIIKKYEEFCGRKIKIVYIYFNNEEQKDIDDLQINGFNFYRTEECIKRYLYSDI